MKVAGEWSFHCCLTTMNIGTGLNAKIEMALQLSVVERLFGACRHTDLTN
jgi:hypothetical protein